MDVSLKLRQRMSTWGTADEPWGEGMARMDSADTVRVTEAVVATWQDMAARPTVSTDRNLMQAVTKARQLERVGVTTDALIRRAAARDAAGLPWRSGTSYSPADDLKTLDARGR
ncbi:MAG: hypothetical protein ACK4MD_07415 [Demequina sp.]